MRNKHDDYWKSNLKYLGVLLSIWFIVSFLFGIVFAESLNQFKLAGFPLGFWFAHQGSIYTFVLLIFIYVILMNKLDKKFDVDEN
tara:strand:- start:919 stop:1173 length:255 start_codon:yes stop_codon:yes gene_type:complete